MDAAQTTPSLPPALVWLGKALEDAISTQWVVLILVPILIVAGSVLLKRFAKKKRQFDPTDKLFGFDLGLTACLTLLITGFVLANNAAFESAPAARQHYLTGLFLLLIIFVGLMIGGAVYMHHNGWDDEDPEKLSGNAHWLVNAGGLFFLIAAFVLTGGSI